MIRLSVLCVLLLAGLAATENRALGSHYPTHCYPVISYHCSPCYYPCYRPCYRYCYPIYCHPTWTRPQPDETPIEPKRPKPDKARPSQLDLVNTSKHEYFVLVYLKRPGCYYSLYAKHKLKPGASITAKEAYYIGDDVFFETWWRAKPHGHWHFVANWGGHFTGSHHRFTANTGDFVPVRPKGDEAEESDESSDQARMVIRLPAEAKLKIEGQPTRSAGTERTFVTPKLVQGEQYSWTLELELMQGDKPVTWTKKVSLTAGQTQRVTLTTPVSLAGR